MEEKIIKDEIIAFHKWMELEVVPVDGVHYKEFQKVDDLIQKGKKAPKFTSGELYEEYLKSKEGK